MAEFKEELVINALHPEKAEIGKKYYFADDLICLKAKVEACNGIRGTLASVGVNTGSPFYIETNSWWKFLYPYEEPPKQRMTYRMLSEWIAKGNGEYTHKEYENAFIHFTYNKRLENDELTEGYFIRPWDSDEWIEPTVDIYERDCKGGK